MTSWHSRNNHELWEQFEWRRDSYRNALVGLLRRQGAVSLLTDMPGNLGDHVIWRGTDSLIELAGIPVTPVTPAEVLAGADPLLTLVIPGNAAMDGPFNEWLPDLVETAGRRPRRVIILPSKYDTSVPSVATALRPPNVTALARDPASYRMVKQVCRAGLAMDPAVMWPAFDELTWEAADMAGEPLVVLRTDVATNFAPEPRFEPRRDINNDISATATDLEDFLARIVGAPKVVTDRLHVAVCAILIGIPVDFVDPYDRKISTYLEFTFRAEWRLVATQRSVGWLGEAGFLEESLDG